MGTKVAEAVAVGALVGVLERASVAVGILVGVLDGVAVRVEVGFFVGVCVGTFVSFDPLAVALTIVGDFVSDACKNKLAVGEKDSVGELAGMAGGGASFVSPKLINATVETKKRKLMPNNQRALVMYPRRKRKFASLRPACRVRIPNP